MSSAGNVGKTDNIRNHLQLLSTKKFIDSFFSYSCFFVFVVVFALALQKKYTNREKIQLNDEDDAQNRRPYQSTHGGYRLQVVRFFLFGRKIQSHLRFHLTHVQCLAHHTHVRSRVSYVSCALLQSIVSNNNNITKLAHNFMAFCLCKGKENQIHESATTTKILPLDAYIEIDVYRYIYTHVRTRHNTKD